MGTGLGFVAPRCFLLNPFPYLPGVSQLIRPVRRRSRSLVMLWS